MTWTSSRRLLHRLEVKTTNQWACYWSKSDPVQDGDTCPSPSNSLRYIRTLLRSPYYFRPPPDPLRSEVSSVPKKKVLNQTAPATVHLNLRRRLHHLFSSMFIKCDATQRGQLWTTMDFTTCNPYKPVPMIATFYNKSTCANRADILPTPSVTMSTAQLSLSKPRPPIKKKIEPPNSKGTNFDLGFWF